MTEGLRRRREADCARRAMYQIVSGERLNKRSLAIAARAKYRTLDRICAATPNDYINRAMLARVLARRRDARHRIRHLAEPAFLFGGRQWTNLLLEQFLRGGYAFHNLAVEQSAKRAHVRHLRMILVPDGMGEPSPRQSELSLNAAGYDDVIASGTRPRLVGVLFEKVSVGLNHGEDGLGRAER